MTTMANFTFEIIDENKIKQIVIFLLCFKLTLLVKTFDFNS